MRLLLFIAITFLIDVCTCVPLVKKSAPMDTNANVAKFEDDSPMQISFNQADESKTVSIIMQTMLPSMFGLFRNITNDDYKANFQPPCTFDILLDLFKQLPPYFDIISLKYPTKPDLAAYYSMQLASTFLVNNGSLTMKCLYNMLSLQTRLMTFSLDIMDNPEKNPQLVGLFGVFMKPVMSMLKQNAMMKIIDHVDRYDKNDDLNTVNLFNLFNFLFCVIGFVGILSNILLVILLRNANPKVKASNAKGRELQIVPKPSIVNKPNGSMHKSPFPKENSKNMKKMKGNSKKASMNNSTNANANNKSSSSSASSSSSSSSLSRYKQVKSLTKQFNRIIRIRYQTRDCLVLIAICHSLYLLINFMIMSQAGLAAVALQGLSNSNIACKLSFALFPPTTAYNILHQFAIWLLVYAIVKHSSKLRNTKTYNADADADFNMDLFYSDENIYTDTSGSDPTSYGSYDSLDDEQDTVSHSLTNNSHTFPHSTKTPANKATVHFVNNTPTINNNRLTSMQTPSAHPQMSTLANQRNAQSNEKNSVYIILLFILLVVYNGQNVILYSLNTLNTKGSIINYCAFNENYAQYYNLFTQMLIPVLNLVLFCALPLLICTITVLLDISFLLRMQREQTKRYEKLKDIIEWPLYYYFAVYIISQVPFGIHQMCDLIASTSKFPFVFPLFIQMKFTSKVWLVIFEMILFCLSCASDFYIWFICDRHFRQLAKNWINKRVFCRSYNFKHEKSRTNTRKSLKKPIVTDSNSNENKASMLSAIYTSATASGDENVGIVKKPLNKHISDSLIASATLPAASNFYGYDDMNNEQQQNIKMIDTDNEDMINDSAENEKYHMSRLDEDDEIKINNYSHPPSFKSAVIPTPDASKNKSSHQYQNVFLNNINTNTNNPSN